MMKPIPKVKLLEKILKNPTARVALGGMGAGIVVDTKLRKKAQNYGYDDTYSGGDIWPNPDKHVASLEQKCFYNPKCVGG